MKRIILTLLFFIVSLCLVWSGKGQDSPQYQLYHHLLDGYLNVRPVINQSEQVTVQMNLRIEQIKELSSVYQQLSVCGSLHLSWMDPFLKWNRTEYELDQMIIPATMVWTPDIAILNSVNGVIINEKWRTNYKVAVTSEGRVSWKPGVQLTTSCDINTKYFPYDIQTCEILISSLMRDAHLTRKLQETPLTANPSNSEWNLIDITVSSVKPGSQNHANNKDLYIKTCFTLERRYERYVNTIFLPMLLLSLTGTLIFALPPESGEKISLGVTTMLGFFVLQLTINDNLPQSSAHTPMLMVFVGVLMTFNALSILLSVGILLLHHKESPSKLPHWLQLFIFGFLGKIVCKKQSQVDYNSKGFHHRPEIEENNQLHGTGVNKNANQFSEQTMEIVQSLKNIIKEIQLTRRILLKTNQVENIENWRRAALIIDRFLFYLSVTACILISAIGFLSLHK